MAHRPAPRLLGGAAGGLWAYKSGKKDGVEVALVRSVNKEGEAYAVLNASGYATPRRRATVAAKITGRVVEMRVEEGMRVTEGQILACGTTPMPRFDSPSAHA